MALDLRGRGLSPGSPVPLRCTCWGGNLSPELEWSGVPSGARVLALLVDNPDAPIHGRVHWVLFNLPATVERLPEGLPRTAVLAHLGGALQGRNHLSRLGWDGPCPPPGPVREYVFSLFALRAPLRLEAGASMEAVLAPMQGLVLATARLTATCEHHDLPPAEPAADDRSGSG